MSKKTLKASLILLLSIGLLSPALAQRQTGTLEGTVSDTEGAILAGVEVTISGEQLMGILSYVTGEDGSFRFPAVSPGVYDVKIELPGFRTMTQEGILVRVGKTTTLDIVLEVTALEEEITVIGLTPTVDIRATKVSVSYTAEIIGNIPMGRDLYDLIASAPGVISENVTYRRTASTHGSTVRGNQYSFDGFLMNDPVVSYLATNINFDAFAEVEMGLHAHPAEVGMADGAYINIVTKSGGNKFHGMAQVYYTGEKMVDTNFTEHQIETFRSISPVAPTGEITTPPAKTIQDIDTSFQLGGPIILDKLWFFGSFRWFRWKRHYTGFVDPDSLAPVEVSHKEWNVQAKLTFQISDAFRLTANYYRTHLTEPYMTLDVGPYSTPEACAKWEKEHGDVIYGKLNWVIDQNTFADFRAGYINRFFPEYLQDELGPQFDYGIYGNPHYDYSTGFYYGSCRFGEIYNRGRLEFLGSLTRFVDNFIGGDHEIKLGFEHERARGTWETWLPHEPGAWFNTVNYKYMWTDWGSDYGYVSAFAVGTEHGDSDEVNRMNRWSAYLQDSFTVADRFTINLGVRYDWSTGIIPESTNTGNPFWQNILDNSPNLTWLTNPQPLYFAPKSYPEYKDYMTWSTFAPRVGIVFDPFGDGRSALKASYSRYYAMMMLQFTGLPNPNYIHTGDFYWYDTDKNNWPDVSDTYEFTWLSREEDPSTGLPDLSKMVDEDVSAPYTDEVSIGIEREVFTDFSVGINLMRKWDRNMVERYNREPTGWAESSWSEPGPDGVWNTADDISFPVYLGSDPSPVRYVTNIDGEAGIAGETKPTAERNYKAIELLINKKMSNRWQFFGSVVYSKAEGNLGQSYGQSWGGTSHFAYPTNLINDIGRLNMERPLVIKLSGTYQAPYDVNISFFFTHYSGYPYRRYVRVYGLDPWSSYRYITTQPMGTYRRPHRDLLDIRVEKTFNFGPGKLGLFLDIFNALNEGYVSYYAGYAGRVYYGQEGRWVPNSRNLNEVSGLSQPRVFKVSVRYSF